MTKRKQFTDHDMRIAKLVCDVLGLRLNLSSPESVWQVLEAIIVDTPKPLRDKRHTLPKLHLLCEGVDSLERMEVLEGLRGSRKAEALLVSMIEKLEGYRKDIAEGAATPEAMKD